MPELLDLDGIPCLFERHEGPTFGCLVFRVGWADETPESRGITHLIEHLALGPSLLEPASGSGEVRPLSCGLRVHGDVEDCERSLEAIAARLAELPLDGLAVERQVLEREADVALGAGVELLAHRYGSRGAGLRAQPQRGVWSASPEALRSWATERFTADNVVGWWLGPRPPQLDLPLAPGRAHEARETIAALKGLPGWVELQAPSPAASLTSSWGSALMLVLGRRIFRDLRVERGLVYALDLEHLASGPRTVDSFIYTDAAAASADAVLGTTVRHVRELARKGPQEEEVSRARARLRHVLRYEAEAAEALEGAARAMLLGALELESFAWTDRAAAWTVASTREAAQQAADSLLLGVPDPRYGAHLPVPRLDVDETAADALPRPRPKASGPWTGVPKGKVTFSVGERSP